MPADSAGCPEPPPPRRKRGLAYALGWLLAIKLAALWLIYQVWFSAPMPESRRATWLERQVYSIPADPVHRRGDARDD